MAIVQHSTSPLIMLLLCSFYCIFLNSKQLSVENGEFSFWCNFPGALSYVMGPCWRAPITTGMAV